MREDFEGSSLRRLADADRRQLEPAAESDQVVGQAVHPQRVGIPVLKTTAVTESLWTSSPSQKMGVEEGLGRDSPPEGERATGFSEGSTGFFL